MKFLTTSVEEIDRHTEPRIWDLEPDAIVPSKNEEITLKITLVGSGDTRKFTSAEIISEVMSRLAEIEHKKETLSVTT